MRDHKAELQACFADPWALVDALDLRRSHKARRVGQGVELCCLWHEDRTPSCSMKVGREGYVFAFCHSCKASGDPLAIIAAARGLDPRRDLQAVLKEAANIAQRIDILADIEGRNTPSPVGLVPKASPRIEQSFALSDDQYDAAVRTLLDLCPLDSQSDVTEYLDGRGVLEGARLDGWGALPPHNRQRGLIDALIGKLGVELLKAVDLLDDSAHGSGYRLKWSHHRVLIPWRTWGITGQIDVLQRRRIDGNERPKYVASSGRKHLWPYGVEVAAEDLGPDTAVAFVEGAFDVLALRELAQTAGHDVVVLGVPGVRHWQPSWSRWASGRVIRLAFDNDQAGDDSVHELVATLQQANPIELRRTPPPIGKDWCETLLASRAA